MPGGDRTGPMGMGPMTGRAAGSCAGFPAPGYMNPSGRGGGFGFGSGRGGGRGYGFGRGFGWRRFAFPYASLPYPAAYPYSPELSPQQEADMLKEQAKAMEEEIVSVNERISTLEKAKGSQKDG